MLEDWALDGSWVQDNGLGAGFVLSMLVYLLWLYAANKAEEKGSDVFFEQRLPSHRSKVTKNTSGPFSFPCHQLKDSKNASDPFFSALSPVINRDTQTILVLGLLQILLMSPPDSTVLLLAGAPVPMITVAAILLASLSLLADRCAGMLMTRLLLLLPLLIIAPLTFVMLGAGQGPVISTLTNLFPDSGSDFTPTGFSPYQQLRASMFLRPSTRAVMRIESDTEPDPYLAGNRLVRLDDDLQWLPAELPLHSLSAVDAEPQANGEWRYPIANHHASSGTTEQRLSISSLSSDNYLFVSPGTSHITGRFGAINRNAADVWSPAFERGTDKRWQLETGGRATPEEHSDENLQLPNFWDASLQKKSEGFRGDDHQQTVDKVLNHYVTSIYALETNFDPERPFHDFFLNDRPAYCFWFASATTLALRANGIPSRMVGGYVIHERLSDALWLVRQRDAHSWVEWQDAEGYWHTIDPTPPSIIAFFGGYESSPLSSWYHNLASTWQKLIDRILADELSANIVRWGGLLILAFLFVREYRRIRGKQTKLEDRALQWQKLWQRFLRESKLPVNASWTATAYAENLPSEWPAPWAEAVKGFLHNYNVSRFSENDERTIRDVEAELEKCTKIISP